MTFFRITHPHPYLPSILNWYETAFPADERRSADALLALLPEPDMHLCGLVAMEELVGFMLYWQWDDILFLEHFAIDPNRRGQQYGQAAMACLRELPHRYLVLEVERPADEISQRRIRFYERQCFVVNPFDYEQPPYRPGFASIPMRIMSAPALTEAEYVWLSQLIKARVYERFY